MIINRLRLCCAVLISCVFILDSLAFQQAQLKQSSQDLITSMDSLFSPASNSEEFMIIESKKLIEFKSQLRDQFARLEKELVVKGIQPKDSISAAIKPLQQQSEVSKPINNQVSEKGEVQNLYPILAGVFLISSLVLLAIYFGNLKKVKESQKRIADLENEFTNYKSTMIDRERKLMRELIDARNPEE